jgi:hypothetical protein
MIVSWPLIAACFWALAAGVTAMLPYRRQFPPGIVLLVAAPVILIWIAVDHGVLPAALGTLGFLSMFRNPMIYLVRRALGLPVRRPDDPARPLPATPSTPASADPARKASP